MFVGDKDGLLDGSRLLYAYIKRGDMIVSWINRHTNQNKQ